MSQYTYDILVKYNGANGMDVTIPIIGRKWLNPGHTMLIKNATAGIIETVRKLKPVNVNMNIVTKATRLDIPSLEIITISNETSRPMNLKVEEPVVEQLIPIQEPITEQDGVQDLPPVLESDGIIEQDNPTTAYENEDYVIKKGTFKGKSLKDIEIEKLQNQFKYLPKEDKPEVQKYLDSIKGE